MSLQHQADAVPGGERVSDAIRAIAGITKENGRDALRNAERLSSTVVRVFRALMRTYLIQWGRQPFRFDAFNRFMADLVLRREDSPLFQYDRFQWFFGACIRIGVLREDPAGVLWSNKTTLEPCWEHPAVAHVIADIPPSHVGKYHARTAAFLGQATYTDLVTIHRQNKHVQRLKERKRQGQQHVRVLREQQRRDAIRWIQDTISGTVFKITGASDKKAAQQAVHHYFQTLPKWHRHVALRFVSCAEPGREVVALDVRTP